MSSSPCIVPVLNRFTKTHAEHRWQHRWHQQHKETPPLTTSTLVPSTMVLPSDPPSGRDFDMTTTSKAPYTTQCTTTTHQLSNTTIIHGYRLSDRRHPCRPTRMDGGSIDHRASNQHSVRLRRRNDHCNTQQQHYNNTTINHGARLSNLAIRTVQLASPQPIRFFQFDCQGLASTHAPPCIWFVSKLNAVF